MFMNPPHIHFMETMRKARFVSDAEFFSICNVVDLVHFVAYRQFHAFSIMRSRAAKLSVPHLTALYILNAKRLWLELCVLST